MWTVLNVYQAVDGFASLFTAKDEEGVIFLFAKQVDAARDLYVPDGAPDYYFTRDLFDFNDSMERYYDYALAPRGS